MDNDIDKFLAYIDGKAAEGKFTKDIAAEAERIKQHKETRYSFSMSLFTGSTKR